MTGPIPQLLPNLTFGQMVEQARATLQQYTTVRPVVCTFRDWRFSDGVRVGVELSGLPAEQFIQDALVELGHELVYVSSHNPVTGETVCPPWFRQQDGTPPNDAMAPNSKATVNPNWPYWTVAQHVAAGVHQLYPSLFAAKSTTLTSQTNSERYVLPDDVEEIISIRYEGYGPTRPQRTIGTWTLDNQNPDGKKYLHIERIQSGRKIYIAYRAEPLYPHPASNVLWSDIGLPETASDLPVLWACAQLIPSTDAARTQMHSVEQQNRGRFVPPSSGRAASAAFRELFASRLEQERRKLLDRYPARVHKGLVT